MNGFDIQFANILYIVQTFWSDINVEEPYFQF